MQYSGEVAPEHGLIDADVIYPATDKHISKYSTQRYTLVCATVRMIEEDQGRLYPLLSESPARNF